MKILIPFLLVLTIYTSCNTPSGNSTVVNRETLFNDDWEFVKDVDSTLVFNNNVDWEKISLPHTAQIEPLVIKDRQWMGDCFYKKEFTVDSSLQGKHIALNFEGAMQVAEIFLNGNHIYTNYGGYLPFYIPIDELIDYTKPNSIIVKLNNEDNPRVPPGKPIDDLDFNIFSGIYRNVWFIVKDKLHISDPIGANRVAGGGIFVSFQDVTSQKATILVQVDAENQYPEKKEAEIKLTLRDKTGKIVKREISPVASLPSNTYHQFKFSFEVDQPELWSPSSPNLYTIEAELLSNGNITDATSERIGIRTFRFTTQGFELNGQPLFIRGTNRHQEYPYIGYALSDNANYRDAYKIREAGFNFVRLSHYPHSKSFMNACDELGLLTMNAIPGWQFIGDSIFQVNALNDVRKMVRRDRNHASIILWEASLNETRMPDEFIQNAHNAVYEEYPQGDVYTCGWVEKTYDVFIPARQHSKPPHYWNHYDKKPILIAEYGDWEYYAHNAGFNQTAFKDLTPDERNSRQLRGFGQKRLNQQALNYQEAHNSNLKGSPAGDANWLMYDYNRGYAPDLEASGIMDIFRLPKFAFYFYKSQAKPGESSRPEFNNPFVEIANYYNDPSFLDVKVYSNCEEVELFLNGQSVGRQKPDDDVNSTHLVSPPFTFSLNSFIPGELTAKGYIKGEMVANSTRKTPGQAASIKLWTDESTRPLQKGVNDVVFLYAAIVDESGTIVPDTSASVTFQVTGDAELIGMNPMDAEAGIASILLKAGKTGGTIAITAISNGLKQGEMKLLIK